MVARSEQSRRVGLLARGDAHTGTPSPRAKELMVPVIEAFGAAGVLAEHVVYADDAVSEVQEQLRALDGVLVWVNPIQDGATRASLDALLRDVAGAGVWVSARPDVILKMGTKEVLFQTRTVGWETETDVYRSVGELMERFPTRLARHGRRVLKQGRGTAGNGVWRIDLLPPVPLNGQTLSLDAMVQVQHALVGLADGEAVEELRLGAFLDRCGQYFAWSGCLVDQTYQDRLRDGMVRCYLTHDEVVGFCHQWPQALLDAGATGGQSAAPQRRSVMEGPNAPAFRALKSKMREWVPQMQHLLDIETHDLPIIWDADFLYGPKDDAGEDSYVLCEINVSAVWPFPPAAIEPMVKASVAQLAKRRAQRPGP